MHLFISAYVQFPELCNSIWRILYPVTDDYCIRVLESNHNYWILNIWQTGSINWTKQSNCVVVINSCTARSALLCNYYYNKYATINSFFTCKSIKKKYKKYKAQPEYIILWYSISFLIFINSTYLTNQVFDIQIK